MSARCELLIPHLLSCPLCNGAQKRAGLFMWQYAVPSSVIVTEILRPPVCYGFRTGLPADTEARDQWLQFLPESRVLPFDRKANFWEVRD